MTGNSRPLSSAVQGGGDHGRPTGLRISVRWESRACRTARSSSLVAGRSITLTQPILATTVPMNREIKIPIA